MPNQADRNDYDLGASGEAQANFNRVASRLESLIDQRDADVKAALADYQADGASEEYQAKEQRWHTVADEVRSTITKLRGSLQSPDDIAGDSMARASRAVQNI